MQNGRCFRWNYLEYTQAEACGYRRTVERMELGVQAFMNLVAANFSLRGFMVWRRPKPAGLREECTQAKACGYNFRIAKSVAATFRLRVF
jgi:hypothetical protein